MDSARINTFSVLDDDYEQEVLGEVIVKEEIPPEEVISEKKVSTKKKTFKGPREEYVGDPCEHCTKYGRRNAGQHSTETCWHIDHCITCKLAGDPFDHSLFTCEKFLNYKASMKPCSMCEKYELSSRHSETKCRNLTWCFECKEEHNAFECEKWIIRMNGCSDCKKYGFSNKHSPEKCRLKSWCKKCRKEHNSFKCGMWLKGQRDFQKKREEEAEYCKQIERSNAIKESVFNSLDEKLSKMREEEAAHLKRMELAKKQAIEEKDSEMEYLIRGFGDSTKRKGRRGRRY